LKEFLRGLPGNKEFGYVNGEFDKGYEPDELAKAGGTDETGT